MSDPSPGTRATGPPWGNPVFLLILALLACAWLAVVAWVTWRYFNPVTDWVGRQNEFLQELLGFVILLAWSLFLGLGIGGAAFLAERAVGRRPEAAPGQTHGRHAGWHRPKGAEEGS